MISPYAICSDLPYLHSYDNLHALQVRRFMVLIELDSALVCAHLFLKPLLTGQPKLDLLAARIAHPLDANGPRETFLRGIYKIKDGIGRSVEILPNQDSSLVTPFLTANCLVRRKADASALDAGDRIQVVPL